MKLANMYGNCQCCNCFDRIHRHHWYDNNDNKHSKLVCPTCNGLLNSINLNTSINHYLPEWNEQINFVSNLMTPVNIASRQFNKDKILPRLLKHNYILNSDGFYTSQLMRFKNMSNGRNTTVISIRVPDEWNNLIEEYAKVAHVTKQDWLKPIIRQALAIGRKLPVD